MKNTKVNMVDLMGQYNKIKKEVDANIISTIESGRFVNGPIVSVFCENLKKFLRAEHVIPCANGTDALQIAYMALGLKPGDEIICPSWTYIATAEAASVLGIKTIFCDVDLDTFNITAEKVEPLISDKTKAIVPVHLYGQSVNMEDIISLARKYNLKVIEDNAQAIGCEYEFKSGEKKMTGTMGDIGTTSFYPSKNLGCFGDGGAIFTNDDKLAKRIKMISNHGEEVKYKHDIIGCNSRLDSIQAEILNIKLKYLKEYNKNRNLMAKNYNSAFTELSDIKVPKKIKNSTHVYHQYTIKVNKDCRDELKNYLHKNGIPTMIYYPIPIHKQSPYRSDTNLPNTDKLSKTVLSLPIHTEIENSNQEYIIQKILNFFK